MTTVATVRSELSDLYTRESAAIQQEFAVTGDGRTVLSRRTALVDTIVQRLWDEIIVGADASLWRGRPEEFRAGRDWRIRTRLALPSLRH